MVPGDATETTFSLSYRSKYPIPTFGKIDTSSSTLIRLRTRLHLPEAGSSPTRGSVVASLLERQVLPRLNYFISYLKFSVESDSTLPSEAVALLTSEVRNVGLADLVYAEVIVDGKLAGRHWSSSVLVAGDQRGSALPVPRVVKGQGSPPKEWSVLSRAGDLVNHGYHLEGFVVGYALLDEKVQEFLKARLGRNELIIDTNRFQQFWGPLMLKATNSSPLENDNLRSDIEWINKKRNFIMHAGEGCTVEDAQRALNLVFELLRFLGNAGAGYVLPRMLHFRQS